MGGEHSLRDLWDNFKRTNRCTCNPKRREKRVRYQNIFEEMAEISQVK